MRSTSGEDATMTVGWYVACAHCASDRTGAAINTRQGRRASPSGTRASVRTPRDGGVRESARECAR
jgi:hypothetical protein